MDYLFIIDTFFMLSALVIFLFSTNLELIGCYAYLLVLYYACTPKQSYLLKLYNKLKRMMKNVN